MIGDFALSDHPNPQKSDHLRMHSNTEQLQSSIALRTIADKKPGGQLRTDSDGQGARNLLYTCLVSIPIVLRSVQLTKVSPCVSRALENNAI